MATMGSLIDGIGGRLTLTSGTPVTTADVVDAGTLYYTPYKGDRIALYDGTTWNFLTFTEQSLDISGYTASRVYDIFIYDNAGTPTLEGLIWTDSTNRATALTTQNGVYVKSGATTRRYLGTICMSTVLGDCDDSLVFRGVWNYYNRTLRPFYISESTQHTYQVGAWRSWNNDATVRVEFVIGVSEEPLRIGITSMFKAVSDGTTLIYVSAGLDTTTAGNAGIVLGNANDQLMRAGASKVEKVDIGLHYYQAVQFGSAVGASTYELARITGGIYG